MFKKFQVFSQAVGLLSALLCTNLWATPIGFDVYVNWLEGTTTEPLSIKASIQLDTQDYTSISPTSARYDRLSVQLFAAPNPSATYQPYAATPVAGFIVFQPFTTSDDTAIVGTRLVLRLTNGESLFGGDELSALFGSSNLIADKPTGVSIFDFETELAKIAGFPQLQPDGTVTWSSAGPFSGSSLVTSSSFGSVLRGGTRAYGGTVSSSALYTPATNVPLPGTVWLVGLSLTAIVLRRKASTALAV
jgi:hypothetical protein